MNDANTLRQAIHRALVAGDLPSCKPERTWGGRGSGEPCNFCREVIPRHKMELELEFGHPAGAHAGATYRVHVPCFSEWEELRDGGSGGEGSAASKAAASDLIDEASGGNFLRHASDTKSKGEHG